MTSATSEKIVRLSRPWWLSHSRSAPAAPIAPHTLEANARENAVDLFVLLKRRVESMSALSVMAALYPDSRDWFDQAERLIARVEGSD